MSRYDIVFTNHYSEKAHYDTGQKALPDLKYSLNGLGQDVSVVMCYYEQNCEITRLSDMTKQLIYY